MTWGQGVVPVDSSGVVLSVDFLSDERLGAPEHLGSVRVLRHLSSVVLVKLDSFSKEFLASVPCQDHADTQPSRACSQCKFSSCVIVRHLLEEISTASTLHTLQGTTAEPGLIFHWNLPNTLSKELRWLAVYVALSRPPSLAQLRSVGLSTAIRRIIEAGPPEGLVGRFAALFDEKIERTNAAAQAAMEELGWTA